MAIYYMIIIKTTLRNIIYFSNFSCGHDKKQNAYASKKSILRFFAEFRNPPPQLARRRIGNRR